MTQAKRPPKVHRAPTREAYFDFLVRCYFGQGTDRLRLCVHRAYLDLNRTLHGIAKHPSANDLREKGYLCVISSLRNLALKANASSSKTFNTWHKRACLQLKKTYAKGGFDRFTVGQAQKWLNMSLKYAFALGESRVPGYIVFYPYAHVPIDNIVLENLASQNGPGLSVPWSRLDNYDEYWNVQTQIRALFPGSAPLAWEFQMWLEGEI